VESVALVQPAVLKQAVEKSHLLMGLQVPQVEIQ
jgi:hypothetical protein